jgi:predicted dinucleotide-binding enzyme
MVGQAIAGRLVEAGHAVMIGSRTSDNERAAAWVDTTGPKASQGTFAEAASFGELIFNCTSGIVSLDALKMAGETNFSGKILIDVANPLEASGGMPLLAFCNTDSLAERIQKAFPKVKVVKALNTMNVKVMINPQLLPGDHTVFISGNDGDAKSAATRILEDLGWKRANIIDLGDITTARGTEMLLPIWLRLAGALGHTKFNFHIVIG